MRNSKGSWWNTAIACERSWMGTETWISQVDSTAKSRELSRPLVKSKPLRHQVVDFSCLISNNVYRLSPQAYQHSRHSSLDASTCDSRSQLDFYSNFPLFLEWSRENCQYDWRHASADNQTATADRRDETFVLRRTSDARANPHDQLVDDSHNQIFSQFGLEWITVPTLPDYSSAPCTHPPSYFIFYTPASPLATIWLQNVFISRKILFK
jgi:hypothetical protein